MSERWSRRGREAFWLTTEAFVWSATLVGAAFLLRVYGASGASSTGAHRSGSLTLVAVNGLGVLVPVAVPVLISVLSGWRCIASARAGDGWSGISPGRWWRSWRSAAWWRPRRSGFWSSLSPFFSPARLPSHARRRRRTSPASPETAPPGRSPPCGDLPGQPWFLTAAASALLSMLLRSGLPRGATEWATEQECADEPSGFAGAGRLRLTIRHLTAVQRGRGLERSGCGRSRPAALSPVGLSRRCLLWASGSSGWCRIGWAPLARQSATGRVAPEARALIAEGAGSLEGAQGLQASARVLSRSRILATQPRGASTDLVVHYEVAVAVRGDRRVGPPPKPRVLKGQRGAINAPGAIDPRPRRQPTDDHIGQAHNGPSNEAGQAR